MVRLGDSRSALIVDDDEVAARSLSRTLNALGYTTAIVRDPSQHDTRPDVVVIDVDRRGEPPVLDVAARLIAEDIPVVLITALDELDPPQLAGRAGGFAVVGRPVARAALRSALDLVRLQRESRTRLVELERQLALDLTERERAMSASRESQARERLAVEASRAKTDFLAHMSHELRTPLNAVLGLSEAMLERIFGELNADQASALSTIQSSGRHLLALINDVLDIARVESGKLPIESEQVVLRPLIDESTALVHGQLTAKGQRLVIELAPALPPVDIDRRRIKQVLLNLLGNASKFSPSGAVVTLRVAARADARQVEIAVADTGPGIAPADRARIFEPFVTLDPSMSRAHGGAGLGLTLAKRIVELHGGQIRMDSELGRGTTFTIALPVSSTYVGDPPPVHRAPPTRAVPLRAAGPTILLAEDDDATVLTVRSYLEGHGYRVRVVRDGMAALDAAAARDVAVVLMDVQLPGLDGLEVTRRLRARDIHRPIIALTAHAMPADERRCLEAGASAYLAKPVYMRDLTDTIEDLLEDP